MLEISWNYWKSEISYDTDWIKIKSCRQQWCQRSTLHKRLEYAEGYKARMSVLEEKMKPIEGDGVNASNSGEKKENYEDPD